MPLPGDPRSCVDAVVLQLDEERGHQVADGWLGGEEVEDSGVDVDVVGREVRQDGDACKRAERACTDSRGDYPFHWGLGRRFVFFLLGFVFFLLGLVFFLLGFAYLYWGLHCFYY